MDIARAANRLYEDAMGGNYGDADFSDAVMEAVMYKGMVDVGENFNECINYMKLEQKLPF